MAFCSCSSWVGSAGFNLIIFSYRSFLRTGFFTSDSRKVLKNRFKMQINIPQHIIFFRDHCHTKRGTGGQGPANPSFGMTLTMDL